MPIPSRPRRLALAFILPLTAIFAAVVPAPASLAADDAAAKVAALRASAPTDIPLSSPTALQNFIRHDDGAFSFELKDTRRVEGRPGQGGAPAGGFTTYIVRLVSQTWRTPAEVSEPRWTHWLWIIVPDRIQHLEPVLVIGGGRRRDEAPKDLPAELAAFAQSGAVACLIDNVPNQPLRLAPSPASDADRTEDAIIARTWTLAMETGDATWLGHFPMTKAAVKAMDAVEQFLAARDLGPARLASSPDAPLDHGLKLGKFFVLGGSKRGWTAWLTAASDPRVGAVAPVVIDILSMPEHTAHHYAAYGFWSPALKDYVDNGITDRFRIPQPADLAAVTAQEDPLGYLPRTANIPKFLFNASGDEFFPCDSSQFYEDKLPGEWHIRYFPNSGHSLKETSIARELLACYKAWVTGADRPTMAWSRTQGEKSDVITLKTSVKPQQIRLWSVDNEKARDFRIPTTGKEWRAMPQLPEKDGDGKIYAVEIPHPAQGWRAAFLECTFESPAGPPMVFTTRVYVVPDTLPHAGELEKLTAPGH